MPYIRPNNQPTPYRSPFWDFVASIEEQGFSQPFLYNLNNNRSEANGGNQNQWPGAYSFPFGGPGAPKQNSSKGPLATPEPPAPFPQQPYPYLGAHGGSSAARGGAWGSPGWSPWGSGPWKGSGPQPWGGSVPWGGFRFEDGVTKNKSGSFTPDVDIFDAPERFVIYVSLPGAKKEDVVVNWGSKNGELSIAGVIRRPRGEEPQKTLMLDERKVGTFDWKVRLGSRDSPVQVEVDDITAGLEDGILTINVPKLESDDIEVKKIDIA